MHRAIPALLLVACGGDLSGTAIPVERGAGTAIIEVEVDGAQVRCMIDTAADSLYVAPFVAGDLPVGTAYEAATVSYGDVTQRAVLTFVIDQEVFNELGRLVPGYVDCLLGFTVLPEIGVLDYANSTLYANPNPRWEPEDGVEARLDVEAVATWPVPLARSRFGDADEVTALLDTVGQIAILRPWVFDSLENPPLATPVDIATPTGQASAWLTDLPIQIGAGTAIEAEILVYDSPQLDAVEQALQVPTDAVIPAPYMVQHALSWDRYRDRITLFRYDIGIREQLVAEWEAAYD